MVEKEIQFVTSILKSFNPDLVPSFSNISAMLFNLLCGLLNLNPCLDGLLSLEARQSGHLDFSSCGHVDTTVRPHDVPHRVETLIGQTSLHVGDDTLVEQVAHLRVLAPDEYGHLVVGLQSDGTICGCGNLLTVVQILQIIIVLGCGTRC